MEKGAQTRRVLEVIELMSYDCKKTCKVEEYCCVQAKLKCTDLCKTKRDNMSKENEDSCCDAEISDIEDDD